MYAHTYTYTMYTRPLIRVSRAAWKSRLGLGLLTILAYNIIMFVKISYMYRIKMWGVFGSQICEEQCGPV